MAIEIREINPTNKKALREFVKFNIDLYEDSPYHVPSLISDEEMTLDPDKNPAFDFCEAVYFAAYREGEMVGRIAGLVNYKCNTKWNKKSARFGFIDFIDDEEVSKALFDQVEAWAKSKGLEEIEGPLGFTDMDHEGLLVEGFEELSTMATTYSFPYYMKHLEALGYVKDKDWYEYRIKIPEKIPEKFLEVAEVVKKRYNLKVRKFKKTKEIWPYAQRIFELINEAYRNLYGYSDLSPKQIEYYTKMYIPMLRFDLVPVVMDETDNPVAVGITLPSLSLALKKAKGKLFPLGWAYLLEALYGKNDTVDLYIIAVSPKYQNKGVNALLFTDLIPIFNKRKFKYAETNHELDDNMKVQAQWKFFEKEHHKTRRCYKKDLK